MKKLSIIALIIATLSFASCTTVSNVVNSNSAAITAGTACGSVLSSLYSQYKSTGKVDIANSSTLLNIVQLGTYVAALRNNINDAAYKTAFTTGLVSGATGLVTNNNSSSTVNSLLGMTGLSNITSTTSSTSSVATSVVSGLTNLFKSLK